MAALFYPDLNGRGHGENRITQYSTLILNIPTPWSAHA